MKADMSRDYYADLELAPTADINEVKKQFRKLGIAHNPDCLLYLSNVHVQLSSTIPTEILDERSRSTPNFRRSSLRTRSSQVRSKRPNMTRTEAARRLATRLRLA